MCIVHVHRHLALSTNNIKTISSTTGLDSIKTLSLARNLITKIENMNDIVRLHHTPSTFLLLARVAKAVLSRATTYSHLHRAAIALYEPVRRSLTFLNLYCLHVSDFYRLIHSSSCGSRTTRSRSSLASSASSISVSCTSPITRCDREDVPIPAAAVHQTPIEACTR